jgi:hypothetical protein
MKILLSVSHFGFLRNLEAGLRELARRGHSIHLLADRKDALGGTRTVDGLIEEFPAAFTFGYAKSPKGSQWHALSMFLRLSLDYWRYLDARYDAAPALRARASRQAPSASVRIGRAWPLRGHGGLRGLPALFRFLERSVPVSPLAARVLDDHRPDLLMLTPLLYFGSQQVDYVRAARQRGIPTLLCVGSWDHLTTKGLVHEVPDLVTVWNESQRREAADFHGIAPERVRVTGAQAYDHWFSMTPRLGREEFLAQIGLRATPGYLLYLCSSPFIAPHEVPFVRSWIAGLRAHADPRLRDLGVLVRPHPQNAQQWQDVDLSDLGDVALWPRQGANPIDSDARADYYHSMYFSDAVVGVNTSAQIESGIIGRPVFSIRSSEFSGTQEGTLHFQHLKSVKGGLLSMADSLSQHYTQLLDLLATPPSQRSRGREFVEAFVRPQGLERAAAPLFADAAEEAGHGGRRIPVKPRLRSRLLKPVLLPLAAMAARAREQKAQQPEVP